VKSPSRLRLPATYEVTHWLIYEARSTGFAPSYQVVGKTNVDDSVRVSDNVDSWDFAKRIAKTDCGDTYVLRQRALEIDDATGLVLDLWRAMNGICVMRDVTDEIEKLFAQAQASDSTSGSSKRKD